MAITVAYSGRALIQTNFTAAYSGERTGQEEAADSISLVFTAAGGTAPTLSGFFRGNATAAAGDWLMAHATDPLQGMGDARYSEGFTVAGTKLKLLMIRNTDATNSITVVQGATAGLPGIFSAASDGVIIQPGGTFLWYNSAGTAALTTTSNDKLTVSVSAGSPVAVVTAAYGP